MDSLNFQPIGYFQNSLDNPNEAPRQPNPELTETAGVIKLREGLNFEDALRDLDGFSQIWVLFHFHKNDHWNPTVMPPRGSAIKRGVFATRSPYRPNPIGMSILDLVSINGLTVTVGPTDLLNGTPILDIKPYLPYVDSHPVAEIGWLAEPNEDKYVLNWSVEALAQLNFLEKEGLTQLRGFIVNQLEYDPEDSKKKRLYVVNGKTLLAYRTWRAEFCVDHNAKVVTVIRVLSGYSEEDLKSELDKYQDKGLHLKFKSFAHQGR